jgi:uncharacterized protein
MKTHYGTALITGASAGIGAAFAARLAAAKHDLVLVARRQERLESLAAELESRYGVKVHVLAADLATVDGMEKVARYIEVMEDLGLLVNNAGFGAKSVFSELSFPEHEEMVQVHITAALRLIHAALPGMKKRRRAAVINVSSISGFIPVGSGSTYSASKSYLTAFSQSLQFELRRTGIRVQALCPGFTHTEFHTDPSFERMKKSIPFFMWMTADEVVRRSLAALEQGRVVYIPGVLNRLAVFFGRTRLIHLVAPLVSSRMGR